MEAYLGSSRYKHKDLGDIYLQILVLAYVP